MAVRDTTVVMSDNIISMSRVMLALSYPVLKPLMMDRDEEDLTLLMPDFTMQEITTEMQTFATQGMVMT